jgi:TPP-dependent pyruvate/acetoin dehydrogenase alpha subunit
LKEHVGPGDDFHLGYRTALEADPWIKNDPIKGLAEMVEPTRRRQIEDEVKAEIRAAFAFAEESPFPEAEELFTDV